MSDSGASSHLPPPQKKEIKTGVLELKFIIVYIVFVKQQLKITNTHFHYIQVYGHILIALESWLNVKTIAT